MSFLDLDALLPCHDATIHDDDVHWTPKGIDLVSDAWARKIIDDDLLGLERLSPAR